MSNLLDRQFDPQDEAVAMRQYLGLVRSGQLRWEEVTTVPLWSLHQYAPVCIWMAPIKIGRAVSEIAGASKELEKMGNCGTTGCSCFAETRPRIYRIPESVLRYPIFRWTGGRLDEVSCGHCRRSLPFELLANRRLLPEKLDHRYRHDLRAELVERYGPGPLLVGKDLKEVPQ